MYNNELIGLADVLKPTDFVTDIQFVIRFNMVPHRNRETNGASDRLQNDLTVPYPVSRKGHVYIFTAIDAYTLLGCRAS
jgi:hypothetical protein